MNCRLAPAWLDLIWLWYWLHWWLLIKNNDLCEFTFRIAKNRKWLIKTHFYDGFVFVFRGSNREVVGFCCLEFEYAYVWVTRSTWFMNHTITIHKKRYQTSIDIYLSFVFCSSFSKEKRFNGMKKKDFLEINQMEPKKCKKNDEIKYWTRNRV